MSDQRIVTAIVGSYREGGIIDRAVDEILTAAEEEGARVRKIRLIDKNIAFCTNCRICTQEEEGGRGVCRHRDDMNEILDQIDRSDALVFASPMNFGTVTAVMKRFIERLACLAYWPWGAAAPKMRNKIKAKRVVIVASAAAPAFLARLTTQMVKLLKNAASVLGAKTIGVLFIGLAAKKPRQDLGKRARQKARRMGKMLAARGRM